MNRHQRRRLDALRRAAGSTTTYVAYRDRAELLSIVTAIVEADETVSGATVISPDGDVTTLDAAALRRGGRA